MKAAIDHPLRELVHALQADAEVRLVERQPVEPGARLQTGDVVEHSIGRKVDETIVSDGRSVVYALNRGVPFFLSNREAQVSQDILRLARSVVGERSTTTVTADRKSTQKKSLFAWR